MSPISLWFADRLLLAQNPPVAPAAPAPGNDLFVYMQFLPLVLIAVLFYVLMIAPQRREQDARKSMLAALKKNDRVITIGGMIGTVASIDGDEVTLKFNNEVRIPFVRSSIQKVLSSGEAAKSSDSKS